MVMLLARFRKELDQKREESSSSKTGRNRAFVSSDGKFREKEKTQTFEQRKNNSKCHNCGKVGHWKSECRGITARPKPPNSGRKISEPGRQTNSDDRSTHAFMVKNPGRGGAIKRDTYSPKLDGSRQAHQNKTSEVWYSDSGASQHISGNRSWFTEYEEFETLRHVHLTDTSTAKAI